MVTSIFGGIFGAVNSEHQVADQSLAFFLGNSRGCGLGWGYHGIMSLNEEQMLAMTRKNVVQIIRTWAHNVMGLGKS